MNDHPKLAHLIRASVLGAMTFTATLALACGGDDQPASEGTSPRTTGTTAPAATATPAASSGASRVAVSTIDYAYQGLPAAVGAGSTITLNNASQKELHEFVALRIPDSERRSVADLVKLPEAQLDAIFTSPPAAVILAPPMSAGFAVVGDGQLRETGRYAIVCFIPVGADPEAYMAAARASGDSPPQVPGGPPHVAQGMFAELAVR